MAESMARNVIDNFEQIVQQLIGEAAAYVAGGEQDEETDGNIRKLRMLSNALNAALNSVQFMPRPPVMPMPPDPQSMAQPPQAPTPQPQPAQPARPGVPPRR